MTEKDSISGGIQRVRDIIMGLIIAGLALVIYMPAKFRVDLSFIPESVAPVLALLFFAYGIWRLYRGIRPNNTKYNDSEK